MKSKMHIGFTVFLIAIFSYAIINALTSYPFGAAISPLAISIPALILCLIQLVKEISDYKKNVTETDAGFVDIAQDASITTNVALKGAGEMLIWLLGLYLAIWIFGFKIAIVAFFIIYLRKKGRVKWRTTLILTGISTYLIFFHFEQLMSIHWPNCIISKWINIPWLFK